MLFVWLVLIHFLCVGPACMLTTGIMSMMCNLYIPKPCNAISSLLQTRNGRTCLFIVRAGESIKLWTLLGVENECLKQCNNIFDSNKTHNVFKLNSSLQVQLTLCVSSCICNLKRQTKPQTRTLIGSNMSDCLSTCINFLFTENVICSLLPDNNMFSYDQPFEAIAKNDFVAESFCLVYRYAGLVETHYTLQLGDSKQWKMSDKVIQVVDGSQYLGQAAHDGQLVRMICQAICENPGYGSYKSLSNCKGLKEIMEMRNKTQSEDMVNGDDEYHETSGIFAGMSEDEEKPKPNKLKISYKQWSPTLRRSNSLQELLCWTHSAHHTLCGCRWQRTTYPWYWMASLMVAATMRTATRTNGTSNLVYTENKSCWCLGLWTKTIWGDAAELAHDEFAPTFDAWTALSYEIVTLYV